jgi:hypothetical protein
MNSSFFTALNTLGTMGVSAAILLMGSGKYLEAGVCGFLGILAYLAYEKFPAK